MLRWSTGSFVPSKAPICGILNFSGRWRCRTTAVNGDSFCCTRASMETKARPFYSLLYVAKLLSDVLEPLLLRLFPPPLLIRGWLITFVVPTRHPLIATISRRYVGIMPPGPAIFSSFVNVLRGAEVLLFLLWNGIAAFTSLLCLLWALHLSGEFRQLP